MATWVLSDTGFAILVWGAVLSVLGLFLYVLIHVLSRSRDEQPPRPPEGT